MKATDKKRTASADTAGMLKQRKAELAVINSVQEKLASLGQLTAGIAHEIKNPLNFINKFSDVSIELLQEMRDEMGGLDNSGVTEEIGFIPNDVEANLKKTLEHGTRADSIVKSMLQYSRGGSGEMEPTHLNALVKEYVNLSFHGMRAGKNPINVDMEFELDDSIGKIPLITENFSRVIINLCNKSDYKPKLTVRTKAENGNGVVEIQDNGPGIPEEMKDKVLQPFFTTKKGTEGTGLGLSITHDIVKAHGGEIRIKTTGDGTRFTVQLNTVS